jgi:DNA-binding protein HU-beta
MITGVKTGTPMIKRDQVLVVASVAGITTKQARAALDAVAGLVANGLVEDGHFSFSGLGTFAVHHRRPRRINNMRTGLMMDLPASAVVKFKPSAELRQRVKERHA